MHDFRHPSVNDRLVNIGRTGSGKTQFGLWILSEAPFQRQPYIIINYKRDALLDSIERAQEIKIGEIPKHPGIYHVHPRPELDDDAMEAYLWAIHAKGRIGIFADEAYNLPTKGAFRTILTQGRSLKIPVIANTQRPAFLPLFIFSEASHITCFDLTDEDDKKKVRRFMPVGKDAPELPKYCCRWFDVDRKAIFHMAPCPEAEILLDRINSRLAPKRRFF